MRRLVFVSLFLLAGCYKYVPFEGPTSSLERGAPVRAFLSEEISVDLNDVTAHNITSMDVEFVRQDDSELVLSAFYLESSSRQGGYLGDGWTVRVPVINIANLELKKFDFWRTAGLVALALGGSYLGWEAIAGAGDEDDPGGDPGDVIR